MEVGEGWGVGGDESGGGDWVRVRVRVAWG